MAGWETWIRYVRIVGTYSEHVAPASDTCSDDACWTTPPRSGITSGQSAIRERRDGRHAYDQRQRHRRDHQGRRRRVVFAEDARWAGAAVAGRAGVAAPCAVAVSDRRPPHQRRTAPSRPELKADAARLCPRPPLPMGAADGAVLHPAADR